MENKEKTSQREEPLRIDDYFGRNDADKHTVKEEASCIQRHHRARILAENGDSTP